MRRRRAVCLVAGASVVRGLTACSLQIGDPQLPDPLPTDVPYAYHLQTERGGSDALLEGTLELVDDCLVVVPSFEGWEEPVVPVLPIASTTWDGERLTVSGERAAIGGSISLGGGYTDRADVADFLPAPCPTGGDDRYFVVGLR